MNKGIGKQDKQKRGQREERRRSGKEKEEGKRRKA